MGRVKQIQVQRDTGAGGLVYLVCLVCLVFNWPNQKSKTNQTNRLPVVTCHRTPASAQVGHPSIVQRHPVP